MCQSLKDDVNSVRDDMNNIFEILTVAKRSDGRIWKERTMLERRGASHSVKTTRMGGRSV